MHYDILIGSTFAVLFMAMGIGQGLAFNVKGYSFVKGFKFCSTAIFFVSLAVFLLSRNVSWVAIIDGFLAIGTLIGFVTTRHERPLRYLAPTRHAVRTSLPFEPIDVRI